MQLRRVVGVIGMLLGLSLILGSSMGVKDQVAFFIMDALGLVVFLWGHQIWRSGRHKKH
ncbi:hypothetical protein [Lacticaseibacillus thailandensis]|uniref:Uncharacterized protein n=1 Tax=Lacticaseibacillus thailandensis DSM 22698 = JCM 13996 TaxID=1423810 RepID=A0A0R2CFR3_9LACO|nr:hypothetical protein [Lacticaseibacillus thailandensis]KRM87273.1 hypothetical protein FD19_GL001431 [Lacticaseibacillus thailandensis DSM 22698 = JCM 13996]